MQWLTADLMLYLDLYNVFSPDKNLILELLQEITPEIEVIISGISWKEVELRDKKSEQRVETYRKLIIILTQVSLNQEKQKG